MSPEEAKKSLGDFYSTEKEELEFIRESIKAILERGKIDEETIKDLNSCEKNLSLLRLKYTERLLRLYKSGYIDL